MKNKKTRLKSKEASRELAKYELQLSKKDQIDIIENGHKILSINGTAAFFYYNDQPLPTLKFLQQHPNLLKNVIVDTGAIKFVVNGADIMRPGITHIDPDINRKEAIVIQDENHHKPLAIGITLYNSEEIEKMSSGKVIKNIHYVGDELWKRG